MRMNPESQFTLQPRISLLRAGAIVFLAALVFLGVTQSVLAQNDSDDPPSRVARLNLAQGAVSFQPAGEQDWIQANPNRPLTTGDSIWADQDARGEMHIGSTSVRLGSQTGITFINLNDRTVQLQLSEGTLELTIRRLDSDEAYEVDTPNVAVSLLRTGQYRIDVDPDGQTTTFTVREGEGEATGGGDAYNIDPRQSATFSGTDSVSYDISNAGPYDNFDNWCASRDDHEDHAVAARYVSRSVTGYSDLDDYGTWESVPDYGEVWVPSGVPEGWAPYRYGHWVWIEPWGWTWVEDEPWGFAPFHYGRWAFVRARWCWIPGPVVVRPVYAPALVAFIGGGGFHVGISIGGGGPVGWFPLGPREVYVPAYHCSPRYVQYVNVTNTTVNNVQVTNVYNNYTKNVNVTNVTYVNRNVTNAVTVVNHDTFVNARPIAPAMVKVQPEELRTAQVIHAAPVAPERQSVIGRGIPARAVPPRAVENRSVIARLPAPPQRVPFSRRQPELNNQPGRPLPPEKIEQMRKPDEEYQHPQVKYAPPARVRPDTYQVRQPNPPRQARPQPQRPQQQKPAKPQKQSKPGKPGKPGEN
ncbi:MAG TPA: DUF6600 domain-containing protein [Candidatus Acidoferrales bacterium]|nr:DUF6600 domain-containing protein [Candidatus Acidoferrales bacterium]